MKMTTKKFLLVALSLLAALLLSTNSFAQVAPGACGGTSGTPAALNIHYVGIGSSAQFQTLAYGAVDALSALSTFTSGDQIVYTWTSSTAQILDNRTGTIDAGIKAWVVYDDNATCDVYIGFAPDSVQGTKDFFCYEAVTAAGVTNPNGAAPIGVVADCWGTDAGQSSGGWTAASCASAVVYGFACSTNPTLVSGTTLPAAIQTFLTSQPVPNFVVESNGTSVQQLPPAYCGQSGSTAGKPESTTAYCFFNAGHTDIRPEDGLYATQRALSSYNTTNGLAGLGYNQANCGATGTGATLAGCPIFDSFGQGKVFYVLNFAISGNDPYTGAAVPAYTTLSLGASPVVVFVNNADSSNTLGFGAGYSTSQPVTYSLTDINRKVLALLFDGTLNCTGDVYGSSTPGVAGGAIVGSGEPVTRVLREPLSGTYNTFEFTGVRTLTGSAAAAIDLNKITTQIWMSDDSSGQELDPRNLLIGSGPGTWGPATNFASGDGCNGNTSGTPLTVAPNGSEQCGDPLYVAISSGPCESGSTPALKVRAITTGTEVKATLNYYSTGGGVALNDEIGYAFWGYGNFAPGVKGCETTVTSGDIACPTIVGHYLTVDGVDPLFETEGGAFDSPINATIAAEGPYNFPQCGGIAGGNTANGYQCQQLPFKHIYDGKYPLWSLLRIVTFNNTSATSTKNGTYVPEGVINVVANAQNEAAPNSTHQLSDFVPFFNTIKHLPYTQGGTLPTGNLNLPVFRSHYKQSSVAPNNGHTGCQSGGVFAYTDVNITGGSSSGSTCLVDTGGDVGGSVLTVRSDSDFWTDFHGQSINGVKAPSEIYDLHQ